MNRKKSISARDITGEQGVALINRITLEMGYVWYPTGSVEAGIDGTIEIRDPATEEVTNCIIQVQSKATAKPFDGETSEGFTYYCKAEDLEYWLNGNTPVILVRSRPESDEAYWISIKDYFRDPVTRQSRAIRFDKKKDLFDKNCASALAKLAIPKGIGLYLEALPRTETLISNLLPLTVYPENIYVAETKYRDPKHFGDELRKHRDYPPREWRLKNERVISFRNLRETPFDKVCDLGTVECFDASEWAFSEDRDTEYDFISLLNLALTQQLGKERVRWDRNLECYYYKANDDLSDRTIKYRSLQQDTSRSVFRGYPSKSDETRIQYYRHSAFRGKFVRYDQQWYLEINPTHVFTSDGINLYRKHEESLSGLKRLERQSAVRGQIVTWAAVLGKTYEREEKLLDFGELERFEIVGGINDKTWVKSEEGSKLAEVQAEMDEAE